MVAALNAGAIDVALLLTEAAVVGRAAGGQFEILSLYVESPLIWGIHVPAGLAVTRVSELEGLTFAISRYGSGSHLMSLALGLREAWPLDQFEFTVVGSLQGAVDAFAAGRASVFLWERFMTQPLVGQRIFSRLDDFIAPWPAFVVCASQRVLDRAATAVEQLVEAACDEAAALSASPTAGLEIAATYGLQRPAVEQWLSSTRWAAADSPPAEAIATADRMLSLAGII
jgi:ABC-type nitrate/sulfonate/bicarbonate transport system substrate-binding protein